MSTTHSHNSTTSEMTWTPTMRIVHDATHDLWRQKRQPPTIREVQERIQRSTSVIRYAWSELARHGVMEFEPRGQKRRLVWMRGVFEESERVVRLLAEHKMLRVRVDRALAVVRESE
jgi:predicted transcriptional regulator